jgi:hypothetical protein
MKYIFLFLLICFSVLPCDEFLGEYKCNAPGTYTIMKENDKEYFVRYENVKMSIAPTDIIYLCKNKQLVADLDSVTAQDIISQIEEPELSKYKKNPGTYTLKKRGLIKYEGFDPFMNKVVKSTCYFTTEPTQKNGIEYIKKF